MVLEKIFINKISTETWNISNVIPFGEEAKYVTVDMCKEYVGKIIVSDIIGWFAFVVMCGFTGYLLTKHNKNLKEIENLKKNLNTQK